MRLSVAVWAKGNTVVNPITYVRSENVVHVEESRIIPCCSAVCALAHSSRSPQHFSTNALIAFHRRPLGWHPCSPVSPEQRKVETAEIIKRVIHSGFWVFNNSCDLHSD